VTDPEPPVRVRPATPADRDQVWPLARDLATSYTVDRPAFERSYASLVADPTALVLVAESPGAAGTGEIAEGGGGAAVTGETAAAAAVAGGGKAIVGYLLATSHLAFHANAPVAWVEEVMVAAPARGLGAGRHLMAAAESWARSLGAAYVALATRRAAPFYRALAYDESATYFKKPLA
jgi:GNAT superfamily N-acetyltransferase